MQICNFSFFIRLRTTAGTNRSLGCSTLGRRLYSALACSRSGRHRLTFVSSVGHCATKAARLASASATERRRPGKQPYAIALADRRLMGMAGLWETRRSPAGERIRSFTTITTRPNELCAELHNRMPAVLKPETWPVWLGEQPAEVPQLKALLAPLLV